MNSICIAIYNGEKYIKDQLESILPQIKDDDEIIISDDGSTDKTIEIIGSYKDKRIRLVFNKREHGIKNNFFNALKNARGDIIFLSDQDDVWFPEKYAKMIAYLKNYTLVHHNSELTNSKLNLLGKTLYEVCHNHCGFFYNLKKNTYYGSHMAFHSSLLKYALPFPKTNEIGHDVWLGFVAMVTGNVLFIDEKLMFYRRNEGSHCTLFEKSKRPLYQKLYSRIITFICEIIFIIKYKIK
ncbi:MAG: glycosyltransferase [Bacteroides sp.]|nr:glycosyltransferase [Prevotella sp.]MCM1408568.1 glycosyltransferase [Treponema brennaborense]MCM1468943.1 glycosyltransferase [Bacteroides sp.]